MSNEAESESAGRMDLGLAGISAAILVLQILQTRIFSFSLDPLVIYLAVGICLLGLGASGTVLAMLPGRSAGEHRRSAVRYALLGALSLPPAHAVFAALAGAVYERSLLGLFALVVLGVPYFCLGMTTASLLVARASAVGRAYAFNLGGSGLGCLVVFPLLNAVGAEHAIGVVTWLALGVAALLWSGSRQSALAGLGAAAALLALAQVAAPSLYAFPPDPRGQLAVYDQRARKIAASEPNGRAELETEYSRWTETGRIDVVRTSTNVRRLTGWLGGPIETRLFVQDASAGSTLIGVGDDLERGRPFFEQTVYGAGYALGPVGDVLIIGLGGAPDVLTALYHDAKRIVGVDINGATVDLARGPFREMLGDPYGHAHVTTHRMDGRTFLRATPDQFDLIQMTGVDTKTLLASGSLSLSDNYLYTAEALDDTLARLRPDGLLVSTRFDDRQVHRLTSVVLEALERTGAGEPARHLFVVKQGIWRALLVKRSPFTAAEIERLHDWVAATSEPPDVRIPGYELIAPLGSPLEVHYSPAPRPSAGTAYYKALQRGRLDDFIARSRADLRPPTDDRPYFFYDARPERVLQDAPESLRALVGFAAQLAVASGILILLPLLVLRRRGLAVPGAIRSLAYFTCLGVGFMIVEIGLFHRFVLLLGHQSYAVSVVLFGLLLGASCGSALSSRLASDGALRAAMAALIVAIVAYAVGLTGLFEQAASASFTARLALSLVLLVALGLGLGIPFPSGLRRLEARHVPLVAWAIGVNGFASVVGSTLAVPISLVVGLQALMLAGALLYVIALLTIPSSG